MRSRRKAMAKNHADLHALTVCRNQLSRIRHRKLVGATLSVVEAWRRNLNAFGKSKERRITAMRIVRILDTMSNSAMSSRLLMCSVAEWRRRSTDDTTTKVISKRKIMNQGIALILFGRSLSQQTHLMQKIGLGIWHANASHFFRKKQFALLEESNTRQQEVLALLGEIDGQSDEDEDYYGNEEFGVPPQSTNQPGSKQNPEQKSSMRRKDTATDSTHLRRKR